VDTEFVVQTLNSCTPVTFKTLGYRKKTVDLLLSSSITQQLINFLFKVFEFPNFD